MEPIRPEALTLLVLVVTMLAGALCVRIAERIALRKKGVPPLSTSAAHHSPVKDDPPAPEKTREAEEAPEHVAMLVNLLRREIIPAEARARAAHLRMLTADQDTAEETLRISVTERTLVFGKDRTVTYADLGLPPLEDAALLKTVTDIVADSLQLALYTEMADDNNSFSAEPHVEDGEIRITCRISRRP